MTTKTTQPITPGQESERTNMDPRLEKFLRRAFKAFNRFMLLMWRLGLGSWFNYPSIGGQIMVIVHVGRKTGLRRRTPVNFAVVDGELYCTSGFGRFSDWYRNICVQPKVEVWLPHERWLGEVEDVTSASNYVRLMREVLIGSGFAARLAGINPRAMSDEDLIVATYGYRLLRIRRTAAAAGPGGPADLTWIWPLAGLILLIWMRRPFRSRR